MCLGYYQGIVSIGFIYRPVGLASVISIADKFLQPGYCGSLFRLFFRRSKHGLQIKAFLFDSATVSSSVKSAPPQMFLEDGLHIVMRATTCNRCKNSFCCRTMQHLRSNVQQNKVSVIRNNPTNSTTYILSWKLSLIFERNWHFLCVQFVRKWLASEAKGLRMSDLSRDHSNRESFRPRRRTNMHCRCLIRSSPVKRTRAFEELAAL